MNKPGMVIIIPLVALAMGWILYRGEEPAHPPSQPPERLVLGTSSSLLSGLAFIAHEHGFLTGQGLEVTLKKHDSGRLALQGMLDKVVDVATVAEYPFMKAVLDGAGISIIGTIASSVENLAIVARRDRGISRIADLRGKRVGMPFGTDSEFLVDALLSLHHLPMDQITKVDVGPRQIPEAIASGQVDAICAFLPYRLEAQRRLGDNQVTFHGGEIYTESFNLAAHNDYIRSHPAIIEKLLRGLKDAAQFATREPQLARDAVAKHVNLDRPTIDQVWPIFDYTLNLNQSLIGSMESQAKWLFTRGRNEQTVLPNFLRHIHTDGLSRVDPGAVRIVR